VLVVGSKLSPSDTAWENTKLLDPTRQSFVQIDIEPRNASWNYPAENVVLGDAAQILGQLVEAVRTRAEGRGAAAARRVAQHREKQGYFNAPEYRSDDNPILPQRVIGELMRNLPEGGIVTCDAGENRILMTHFYQTKAAGGFLQAAGSGPMGFGIPAALAAKLVNPDQPVVACVGDGGFAMTMNGLMTAIEHDIPITVVVFNNHALGWVLHGSGPFAAEFKDFDHAAIARAMGCRGVRVEDPAALGPALQEAIGSLQVSFADITSPLANEASPRRR
jgi:acetolactate synthase-1/2/3 large subunit